MIAGPAFVTPHAVARFRQRIQGGLTYEQALGIIIRGLDSGVRSMTPLVRLDDGVRFRRHVRCAIDVGGRQCRFVATVLFTRDTTQVVTVRSWMRGTSRGAGKGRRPDRPKWTTREERDAVSQDG